jgi:hypothetical protein
MNNTNTMASPPPPYHQVTGLSSSNDHKLNMTLLIVNVEVETRLQRIEFLSQMRTTGEWFRMYKLRSTLANGE